ncbi:MAG: hypothetical protein J6V42_01065 [Clostridia bacterium]|nr:hypothetical protein [Clostridia bacterium]
MATSKYYYNKRHRRKARGVIITIIACLLLIFTLFLIVGNMLGKQAESPKSQKKPQEAEEAPVQDISPYSIQAHPIDPSKVDTAMIELYQKSVKSVSLKATNDKGKLLVSSSLATSLGYQTPGDAVVEFSSVVSKAKNYGMFLSLILDLQAFQENDVKNKTVRLAYEAALVCEFIEKGANEVVVRLSDTDDASLEDLLDFADKVKGIDSSATVGIALPIEYFKGDGASVNIAELAKAYDVVCADITEIPSDTEDKILYLDTAFSNSEIKYYVLRHNMRVLLPSVDAEQEELLQSKLTENSVANWQKIS